MTGPLKVGSRVRVVTITDPTGDYRFLGWFGTVRRVQTYNPPVAASFDDPYWEVDFGMGLFGMFWSEELEVRSHG